MMQREIFGSIELITMTGMMIGYFTIGDSIFSVVTTKYFYYFYVKLFTQLFDQMSRRLKDIVNSTMSFFEMMDFSLLNGLDFLENLSLSAGTSELLLHLV